MATLAEYLRSQGASEDDIKALTEGSFSGAANRAFSKLQADLTAESTARAAAESSIKDLEQKSQSWYNEQIVPEFEKLRNKTITTEAELAKARTALLTAQKQGLLNVAKDLGYDPESNPTPQNPTATAAGSFDPNRYFTRDEILQIAQGEGDAIAIAQDIAYEHSRLFPDKPLNFRELRKRAVAAKKPVEQLWMEEFHVADARAAQAKSAHDAELAKAREEGATAERQRLADQYGNPNTRPLAPSSSPFTPRPATGRDKMPWDAPGSSEALSNDRVARATKKVMETVVH